MLIYCIGKHPSNKRMSEYFRITASGPPEMPLSLCQASLKPSLSHTRSLRQAQHSAVGLCSPSDPAYALSSSPLSSSISKRGPPSRNQFTGQATFRCTSHRRVPGPPCVGSDVGFGRTYSCRDCFLHFSKNTTTSLRKSDRRILKSESTRREDVKFIGGKTILR